MSLIFGSIYSTMTSSSITFQSFVKYTTAILPYVLELFLISRPNLIKAKLTTITIGKMSGREIGQASKMLNNLFAVRNRK